MGNPITCQSCGERIDRDELILRGLSHCFSCGEKLEASLINELKLSDLDVPLNPPPRESRIEIIEADNNRLMISLPAGGKRSRSLGCFAVIWSLISGAVFVFFSFMGLNDPDFPPAVILIPGLFLLIGLVITVIWIRLRFTRGYLFLEPGRAVMQTILFNRKKNSEIVLNDSSRAELVTSYTENDLPVYRVELQGVGKSLSFGTAWERDAKDWYVETLNSFLAWHYRDSSAAHARAGDYDPDRPAENSLTPACPACARKTRLVAADGSWLSTGRCQCEQCGSWLVVEAGEITEATPVRMVAPDELSADSIFRLKHPGVDEWLLSVDIRSSKDSSFGGGCLLVFGIFWESFVIVWTWGVSQAPGLFKYGMLLFSLPFHAIGIGLLAVASYVLFGRFQLLLSRQESWGRWSLGPVRYTRRFRAEAVTEIKLVRGALLNSGKNRTQKDRDSSQSEEFSCILMAAGKTIPVTHGNSSEESRLAAGLVRYCLNDLGIRLQDD
ncbi:MAG TPA: hypothetical protein VMM56_10125 [Planctomycetaceae bacterium]|nr:hypothetical protein [Planctomycetaceae bacterium]